MSTARARSYDWRYKNISTFQKMEERINRIPTPKDISYKDIVLFLKGNGFKETGGNSPHHLFTYKENGKSIKVGVLEPHPRSGGVDPNYIREVLKAIDRSRSE